MRGPGSCEHGVGESARPRSVCELRKPRESGICLTTPPTPPQVRRQKEVGRADRRRLRLPGWLPFAPPSPSAFPFLPRLRFGDTGFCKGGKCPLVQAGRCSFSSKYALGRLFLPSLSPSPPPSRLALSSLRLERWGCKITLREREGSVVLPSRCRAGPLGGEKREIIFIFYFCNRGSGWFWTRSGP